MISLGPLTRIFFRWAVGLSVTLVTLYLLLAIATHRTCITETYKKIPRLSGFDFEISETDCSTLGEDASISIFASKTGQTGKTLLFNYGPAGVDPMPVITALDQHTVQISVPRISDLIFRRDNWEGLTIHYSIGVIDYPTGAAKRI